MSEIQKIVTDVTYAELVALIGASELEPGCHYRITDYKTAHYMMDDGADVILDAELNRVVNEGALEPLTVIALSGNVLDKVATSELYPQDIIHYDWNGDNWKYDLAFGAWDEAVLPQWKGVIYFRHDTINNVSTGNDFRNVLNRRFEIDAALQNNFVFISEAYSGIWGLVLKEPLSFQDFKTFNCSSDIVFRNCVRNVHIRQMRDDINQGLAGMSIINNNVFHVDESYLSICNINISNNSNGNTFVGYIYNMTIDKDCFTNVIIDSGFLQIGNLLWDCYLNNVWHCEFKGNNDALIVGQNTLNTIFENGVSFFTIPDKTFGNGCQNNIFRSGVAGTNTTYKSQLNFTSATHLFAKYNCEIFIREDLTRKLRYVNNSDVTVIVDANA